MEREPVPPTEDERDRLNHNFTGLLQEARVAQTGVQIMFAFLLTPSSTARFGRLGARDLAAAATVFLVAPAWPSRSAVSS